MVNVGKDTLHGCYGKEKIPTQYIAKFYQNMVQFYAISLANSIDIAYSSEKLDGNFIFKKKSWIGCMPQFFMSNRETEDG